MNSKLTTLRTRLNKLQSKSCITLVVAIGGIVTTPKHLRGLKVVDLDNQEFNIVDIVLDAFNFQSV